MKKYEVIDHTADIGLRTKGQDLKELFANAAEGMFDIMADIKNVKAEKKIEIHLKAPNVEELFLLWLSELLFHFNSKKLLFNKFSFIQISENELKAEAHGQLFDPKAHALKMEIKAVTFHTLRVEKEKDAWRAQVIFDV